MIDPAFRNSNYQEFSGPRQSPETMDPEPRKHAQDARQSTPLRTNGASRRRFARWIHWTVGLAAALLVLLSAGGYYHHREQLATIASEHLRLMVAGPSSLQQGVAAEYTISTTAIDGRGLPAEIEAALLDPSGERLKAFRETADEHGRLKVVVPADAKFPPRITLKVAARHRGNLQQAEAELTVAPDPLDTRLTLDRRAYRPGEKLFFRSLTLTRFGLQEGPDRQVRFAVVRAGGKIVPGLTAAIGVRRGAAGGTFQLPAALPDGRYALTVRGEKTFPPAREEFVVRRAAVPKRCRKRGHH